MVKQQRATRAEQAAENRERVLAAAREVFRRKGYHDASVEEIAEEAGFSKGVVYSQFGSKADLFLALLERRIEQRARENLDVALSAPAGTEFAELYATGRRAQQADRAWSLLVLEFRIHAARDPELNRRYAELHARTADGIARAIALVCEREGIEPPYAPEALARLAFAIDNGYALEDLVAPEGAQDLGNEAMVAMIFGNARRTAAE
jgi:AcrR family transcriptional regulator